jgi:hypothetical protein
LGLKNEAEIAAMSPNEYDKYQESLMSYIEVREVKKTALEDYARKMAREMKKDGVSPDKIMKYTGLSEDEINDL